MAGTPWEAQTLPVSVRDWDPVEAEPCLQPGASPVRLLPECCYQHGLWKLALPAGYFGRQHVMQAAPCSLWKGAPSPVPNSFTSLLSCSVDSAHSATSRMLLECWGVCVCSWWDSEHWRIILNHFISVELEKYNLSEG